MSAEVFLNGRASLCCGDSIHFLRDQPDNRYDSVVTDPPYALVSIVKRFGGEKSAAVKVPEGGSGAYARASKGFMQKTWDVGTTAFAVEFWAEVLRVLKPGGFVTAFGGTRTYHRLACAIEDAGFEIRDCLSWNYSQGFPKSHNISRTLRDAEECCSCSEDVPDLQRNLDAEESISSDAQQNLRTRLQQYPSFKSEDGHSLTVQPPGNGLLHGLRESEDGAESLGQEGQTTEMLLGASRPQGAEGKNSRALQVSISENEGREEPGMEGRSLPPGTQGKLRVDEIRSLSIGSAADGANGRLRDGAPVGHVPSLPLSPDADGMRAPSRPRSEKQRADESGNVARQPQSQVSGAWENCGRCGKPLVPDGLGTALKPAMELIALARKPLNEKTVAANVLRWGTGALNIDGCRIEIDPAIDDPRLGGRGDWSSDKMAKNVYEGGYAGVRVGSSALGRFPANIITDGSEEVTAAFPSSGPSGARDGRRPGKEIGTFGNYAGQENVRMGHDDAGGSAARFFYSAKADSMDRLGSRHPTVKPIDLMQWLVRLVTPKNGLVLEPFAGTGTTAEACYREGMRCMMVEREPEYQADIRRRMALVMAGPAERSRESIKAKTKDRPADHGPLFAGGAE